MSEGIFKKFYASKEWKDVRKLIIDRANGLCELCDGVGRDVHHIKSINKNNINDPKITINPENLQLLCESCHSEITHRIRRLSERKNRNKSENEIRVVDGVLTRVKNVYIVCGAPSSGKTTYIKEHMNKSDIAIDYEYIRMALSLSNEPTNISENCYDITEDIIQYLYGVIQNREFYFGNCYISAVIPKSLDRSILAKKLNANIIMLETPKELCLQYARLDQNRKDKSYQYYKINEYFTILEP